MKLHAANTIYTGTSSTASTWNGPICQICNARFLGSHRCSVENLQQQIARLQRLVDNIQAPADRTANCPCRPENGGSGVCGCVLGGPQITC